MLFLPILLDKEKEKFFQKFAALCLFVETSPINFAGMGGNGNRLFTEKQHVQMANNPRSPQCQTEPELMCPSRPPSFFVTIYL
jgi:hypothetical protein